MCKLLRKLGLALLKIADAFDTEVNAYDNDSNIDASVEEASVTTREYESMDYSYDSFLDESKKFDECLAQSKERFVYELNKHLREYSHMTHYTSILNGFVIGRNYDEIINSYGSWLAGKIDAMVRQHAIDELNSKEFKFTAHEYFVLYMCEHASIIIERHSEMNENYYDDIYDDISGL